MRNASGYKCKVKMSGSEKKVNKNACDIFSKEVSGSFTLLKVMQNNGKEMFKKKSVFVQSCLFVN